MIYHSWSASTGEKKNHWTGRYVNRKHSDWNVESKIIEIYIKEKSDIHIIGVEGRDWRQSLFEETMKENSSKWTEVIRTEIQGLWNASNIRILKIKAKDKILWATLITINKKRD